MASERSATEKSAVAKAQDPKTSSRSLKAENGKAEKGKAEPAAFTRQQDLDALRTMLLIRRFEERAGQLYGMGAIGGFCHLYIGQEAVVVGMQMALKDGDQITVDAA